MASDDESNVSYYSEEGECQNYSDSESANHLTEGSSLEQLKSLREKVNWENQEDRIEFRRRKLYRLIRNWQGQLPNLRDIFRLKEIDLLITDEMIDSELLVFDASFIDFLINTGYKDEPDVDEDGKPLLLRTTAVHHLVERELVANIDDRLFQIYKFDVNYTDKDGLTHFHVACYFGHHDYVKTFLELGQDPNCIVQKTGDSPLHVALESCFDSISVIELLLRYGADPNWANKEGSTPLHLIDEYDVAEVFFRINDERCQVLQIDARDEDGNTPLHMAAYRGDKQLATILLKNGANPNLANENSVTPLHVLSEKNNLAMIKLFFKINDELNQFVKIDAKDKFGQTPLQWAVASLSPDVIDVHLDRGADLSSFVFPSTSDFEKFFLYVDDYGPGRYDEYLYRTLAALSTVELLENRGYELKRSDALAIMTFLVKHILRCNGDNSYEDEDKKEAKVKKSMAELKKIIVSPNLSLYDLIRLRPKEAAKQLTYKDCYELLRSGKSFKILSRLNEACFVHLCEKLSRGFFQRWALYPFWELIRYRLPILCCEMIVEQLMNQDLCNICLAAASPSSQSC
ncbi:ankyrin repeat and protein kinase domain-containing protein 1-like [Trichogramma pretiosum]|uniref:ankyrin repeat and protein kinase domain-containing protein 1-like n=1 Tax=Trichogramma pretiosum TaxID=7493 RepID=UPI000C71B0C7|nr:ankyrin repeat and protein kinase domain-containing protein 1-like [Trichogramma pretiosum]